MYIDKISLCVHRYVPSEVWKSFQLPSLFCKHISAPWEDPSINRPFSTPRNGKRILQAARRKFEVWFCWPWPQGCSNLSLLAEMHWNQPWFNLFLGENDQQLNEWCRLGSKPCAHARKRALTAPFRGFAVPGAFKNCRGNRTVWAWIHRIVYGDPSGMAQAK